MRELQSFIRVKVEKNTSTPYFAGSSPLSNLFEIVFNGSFEEKYRNCTVSKVILIIFILVNLKNCEFQKDNRDPEKVTKQARVILKKVTKQGEEYVANSQSP